MLKTLALRNKISTPALVISGYIFLVCIKPCVTVLFKMTPSREDKWITHRQVLTSTAVYRQAKGMGKSHLAAFWMGEHHPGSHRNKDHKHSLQPPGPRLCLTLLGAQQDWVWAVLRSCRWTWAPQEVVSDSTRQNAGSTGALHQFRE